MQFDPSPDASILIRTEGQRFMTKRQEQIGSEVLLLLTAAIWGIAFVFQRTAMDHIGPFTFNALRFALGALVMLVIIGVRSGNSRPPHARSPEPPSASSDPGAATTGSSRASHREPAAFTGRRATLSGLLAGLLVFGGATFQQVGIVYTTAGKAGFITGLYIVLVPVLGIFWRHRPGRNVWLGAIVAVAGLFLLSVTDALTLGLGDSLVLVGAFFWAGHVIFAAWVTKRMGIPMLAFIQFATCSILSLAVAVATERIALQSIMNAMIPVLYGGLVSVGIAYTLQLVGQRRTPPSHAAIIMGQEAVFAALGGWFFLSEFLSSRALLGCALMLGGAILAQLRFKRAPVL